MMKAEIWETTEDRLVKGSSAKFLKRPGGANLGAFGFCLFSLSRALDNSATAPPVQPSC